MLFCKERNAALNLLYNAVGYYKENNATAQLVTVIVRKQPQCISDEGPRKIQDSRLLYYPIRENKCRGLVLWLESKHRLAARCNNNYDRLNIVPRNCVSDFVHFAYSSYYCLDTRKYYTH